MGYRLLLENLVANQQYIIITLPTSVQSFYNILLHPFDEPNLR